MRITCLLIFLALLPSSDATGFEKTRIAQRSVASVPLILMDGLPYVRASIGSTSATLFLDTGSSTGLLLSEKFVQNNGGIKRLSTTQRTADITGRTFEAAQFSVENLSLGSVSIPRLKGAIDHDWGLSIGKQTEADTGTRLRDGVIGLSAFRGRAVLISYQGKRLLIYPPGASPSLTGSGWFAVPMSVTDDGLVINLYDGVRRQRMVLDTGANVTLIRRESSALHALATRCLPINGQEGVCMLQDYDGLRTSDNIVLGPLQTVLAPMEGVTFDGLLGGDLFAQFDVGLDPLARKAWLRKRGESTKRAQALTK